MTQHEQSPPKRTGRESKTGAMLSRPLYLNACISAIRVLCLAVSPDGSKVMSAYGRGSTIVVCNVANNAVVDRRNPMKVYAFASSPDGRTVIAAGFDDGRVTLRDAQTGKNTLVPLKGYCQPVSSIVFSPDGSTIVAGYREGGVRMWDTRIGEIVESYHVHWGAITALAYSHDGFKIATALPTNMFKILDLRSGRIEVLLGDRIGVIKSVVFSPDDAILVSVDDSDNIAVWSVTESKVIWQADGVLKKASFKSVAFSPDGTTFASGWDRGDRKILLWNTTTKKRTRLRGHIDPSYDLGRVISVAFFQDGKQILSGSSNGAILLWDVETRNILRNINVGPISSVAVLPDCSQLATYGAKGAKEAKGVTRIWEIGNAFAAQEMLVEDIRSQFDSEDLRDSTFYSPKSIELAMSRIAKYHADGWVSVDDRNIFWTSPDLLENICLPYNGLVIGPLGTTIMDYSNMKLCIGKKWVNCWKLA